MKALINNKDPSDVMTEDTWLDWFGPNGEELTGYMGYHLAEGTLDENREFIEGSQPAAEQDREAERIAELEKELKRLKGGRA